MKPLGEILSQLLKKAKLKKKKPSNESKCGLELPLDNLIYSFSNYTVNENMACAFPYKI